MTPVRPRTKRDFGTIRKRANGRWQAFYMGPDQGFHRAPSTFETKMDAEAWLVAERRLLQSDEWSPARSRRARVVRSIELFGPYAEEWLAERDIKPRTRTLYRRQLDRFLLSEFGEFGKALRAEVGEHWNRRLHHLIQRRKRRRPHVLKNKHSLIIKSFICFTKLITSLLQCS